MKIQTKVCIFIITKVNSEIERAKMTKANQNNDNDHDKTGFYLLAGWVITTLIWWSFAFAPITSESPDWLKRAQYVCFGSLPGGLPNSGGWLLLIGGPLLLFLALIIGFFDELKTGLSFIKRSQFGKIMFATLFVFTLWQGVVITKKIKTTLAANTISFENLDLSALPDNYPKISTPLPGFTHISHIGHKISSKDALGKMGFITFVFSHCATVCPTLTKNIINVLTKLPTDNTYAWFITLDPWRDTPSLISQQADLWHLPKNAYLLSDKPEAIQKTLDLFNVPRSRNEKTGEVTHPGLVYLVNQKGELTYMFNNPSHEWLLQAAKKILENPNITESNLNLIKHQIANDSRKTR
jgi:protein SCO1/2